MAFWPFRRKSSRRKSRGGDAIWQGETMQTQRGHEAISEQASGIERRRSRKDSTRGKSKSSSKDSKKTQRVTKRRRTYSFSPGRNDTIHVLQSADQPPVPPLPVDADTKARAFIEKLDLGSVERPQRASTQPLESKQEWPRVPTLHKRSAQDLPRKKSSKRIKADHDREAEIKAMVPIMPTRPATDFVTAGRPVKKESKRMRDGSNISLPSATSIHSSLSGNEEQNSFTVSPLEALIPRPTVRYAENPRYGYERSRSQKRKVSNRIAIPEETLKANKRVHDLANDLTSGELRELMERDKKRKEKKKIADKIKLEKKLAQREKEQQEEEAAAIRNGTPPPVNMERGVFGRDVVGRGIESGNSAVVTSSKRKGSTSSGSGRSKRPTELFEAPSVSTRKIDTAKLSPPASPTMPGSHKVPSSTSQMMDIVKPSEPTPESTPVKSTQPIPIPPRKGQEHNNKRLSGSWTSFFRRNPKSKQEATTSSFSNTSRDSMQSGQGPSMSYTPIRMPSSLPKRTMSKFREDLPELPISPPDSRFQSPEADLVPPIREYPDKRTGLQALDDQGRDTPMSGVRSLEMARLRGETPTSGHRSIDAPSPDPAAALSQSLASVDSEGSWLSGRRGGSKRGSAQSPHHPLRESASSLDKRYKDFSESSEELGIAEDEYFSRLTPGPEDQFKQRQSATMPSSDDEEGGSILSPSSESTKWGTVTRKATVVHHEPRAKSREGMLNDFEASSISDLPIETLDEVEKSSDGFNDDAVEEDGVRRATSIELSRGHARQISAGSAKLLDLKRGSEELEGLSS